MNNIIIPDTMSQGEDGWIHVTVQYKHVNWMGMNM